MDEMKRLAFVEERDGKEAMLKFCEQSLYAYVQMAIKESKYAESIDAFENALEEAGKFVLFVEVVHEAK